MLLQVLNNNMDDYKKIKQYMKKRYHGDKYENTMYLFPDGFMLYGNQSHDIMQNETLEKFNLDAYSLLSFGIARCGEMCDAYYLDLECALTTLAYNTLIDNIILKNPNEVYVDWKGRGYKYSVNLVRKIKRDVSDNMEVILC